MNGKNQIKCLGVASVFALLMAIFGFISLLWNDSVPKKILIVICSILLLVLSFIYIYIIYLSIDKEPNFFLYDRILKRNISLSSLTWKIIDDRLNGYISEKFGGILSLWTSNLICDARQCGYNGALQPLIAYKMLCDIALDQDGTYFELFENTDINNIYSIGYLLEKNGDNDMSRAIISYRSRGGNSEKFYKYLRSNAKYIQSRMVIYIRNNIEKFY